MAKKKTAKKSIRIPKKYVIAVNEGVKWLDMTVGRKEWLQRMDMSHFIIQSGFTCVAGNVFKNAMFRDDDSGYESFIHAVNLIGGTDSAGDQASVRFGFTSHSERGWQYLQDLWVQKINNLKRTLNLKK